MDDFKIQALIAQNKVATVDKVDPDNTYLQVGIYQPDNQKRRSGNANVYPSAAMPLSELLNNAGGLTCLTLPNCQEIIDINADIASINAILPTKFNTPTGTTSQYVRGDGSLAAFPTIPAQYNPTAGTGISITGAYPNQTITNTAPSLGGTVTSVGLSMPAAFNVANSPVTGADTIAVTAAGLSSQYIRGDGVLSNFPEFGGGGASASYYLNGGTSQGSFGGNTYYEINRLAVAGAPATFTRTAVSGDGYIAYFITDVADPSQLSLPGGNWDFKLFMNADSSGGTPSFYVELYKYDGVSFTLIADNSTNPKAITGGATVDLYTVTLAVSTTTLTLTDRLAVRIYVNVGGKDITLNTQDGTLCQILTTFTTGLTALNGLTPQIQTFAVGQSGTDFNINSAGSSHTFNLPVATATESGKLSNLDWITFSNKLDNDYYIFSIFASPINPVDSTTYYFIRNIPNTIAANNAIKLGFSGVIEGAVLIASNNTVAGTTENTTIAFRNITTATSHTISNTFKTNATATIVRTQTITGLNIAFLGTDDICMQLTTPVYATNPQNLFLNVYLYIRKL